MMESKSQQVGLNGETIANRQIRDFGCVKSRRHKVEGVSISRVN